MMVQRQEFVVGGGDKARNVAVEYRYEAKRGTGTQRDPNAHFYVKVNSAREYSRVVLHQHHMPVGPQGEGEDDATLDVSLDGLRRRYIVNAAEDRIFVHSAAFGESVLTLKSRYAQAFVGDAAGEGEYIAQMPGMLATQHTTHTHVAHHQRIVVLGCAPTWQARYCSCSWPTGRKWRRAKRCWSWSR
jgi:hypothetical protein